MHIVVVILFCSVILQFHELSLYINHIACTRIHCFAIVLLSCFVTELAYGEMCSNANQCSTSNAVCNGTCMCNSTNYYSNLTDGSNACVNSM